VAYTSSFAAKMPDSSQFPAAYSDSLAMDDRKEARWTRFGMKVECHGNQFNRPTFLVAASADRRLGRLLAQSRSAAVPGPSGWPGRRQHRLAVTEDLRSVTTPVSTSMDAADYTPW
jgi:hypothetical protein